jgi:hypothetical protein
MSIEVVIRGKPPAERSYTVTCRCKSVLKFLRRDAKFTSDQREGDFLTISCPVCAESVHVNASAYDEK